MQTDHLHFLLEIARQGSINKAAEALHLPRTHLSRVLATLEHNLGVTIFERLPRGVRPTEEGRYILAQSEKALSILDEMESHFAAKQENVFESYSDHITLYCPSHMRSRGQISQVIKNWQEKFPNAQLTQKSQHATQLADTLAKERSSLALVLDAPALTGTSFALSKTSLRFIPLAESQVVALASADHPLAAQKSISLKVLCKERLILISQADDEPPAFYELLARYGTPNVKQIVTGNTALFQEMVASGRYVSIGTAMTTATDGLAQIPLKEKISVTGGLLFLPEAMASFPLRTLAEDILRHYDHEDAIPLLKDS